MRYPPIVCVKTWMHDGVCRRESIVQRDRAYTQIADYVEGALLWPEPATTMWHAIT